MTLKIEPGVWFLTERMTYGRFGLPKKVIRVSRSRVYYEYPERSRKTKEIEGWVGGYCAVDSILRVVSSEEVGLAAWEYQLKMSAIYEDECKKALTKFHAEMSGFFDLIDKHKLELNALTPKSAL